MPAQITALIKTTCFHCGEYCSNTNIRIEDKRFCCEGCKLVYRVLNQEGLCDYYTLNKTPGQTQLAHSRKEKFSFLDNEAIRSKLINYSDDRQMRVTLYIPQIHCSSCLYLLENLHRLNKGIISSKVNFTAKEVTIIFIWKETSLRAVAELLTGIGYEPHISLNDLKGKKAGVDKKAVYRLGIAGFCFGNIMLMSFPEYLGIDASEAVLRKYFSLDEFCFCNTCFFICCLPVL